MATIDVVTFDLSVKTKAAGIVARSLMPLVALRILSVERATSIAMRFGGASDRWSFVRADRQ